jgi:predicted phosphodiesterase
MNKDLDVIVRKFPHEQDTLRVYAIGDVHVGSQEFDEKSVKKKIQIIQDDPYGVVCLCGDLGDYGLKNSRTNVYQATMQPKEQQEYIYELFLPIKDKIVSAVAGNHEDRVTREVGLCPLYDLCVLWGIPDVYRENMAIVKYMFGSIRGRRQQFVFYGMTSHGTTRNKHKKFINCIDGVDFSISGHTHTPEYSPHGKLRIDRIKGTMSHVPYKEIVVDANLKVGGYGLKKEYEVAPPPELQYLELTMVSESDNNRTLHRIMNYHSITI